ncbi:MAG: hypothetical protein QW303_01110 [Nitrososphaerota archaeon]
MQKVFSELFSTYFTNCYWIALYNESLVHFGNEKFKTQEESYRYVIQTFNRLFCERFERQTHKPYYDIMNSIYLTYKNYTEGLGSFDQFADKFYEFITPQEYHNAESRYKHQIIHELLCKIITRFSSFALEKTNIVINPNFREEEKRKNEMISWKKYFIDVFNDEINKLHAHFMAQESGIKVTNFIPSEIYDKIKIQILNLTQEKAEIVKKYNKCISYIVELKKIISKQQEEITMLKSQLEMLSITKQQQNLESSVTTETQENPPQSLEQQNPSQPELNQNEYIIQEDILPVYKD